VFGNVRRSVDRTDQGPCYMPEKERASNTTTLRREQPQAVGAVGLQAVPT
jgi:hypothetical protein